MDLEARRETVKKLWDAGMGRTDMSKKIKVAPATIERDLDALGVTIEERKARSDAVMRQKQADRAGSTRSTRGGAGEAEDTGGSFPVVPGEGPPAPPRVDRVTQDPGDPPEEEEALAMAARMSSPPKLSSYAQVGFLGEPLIADVRRQEGTGWSWVATWNPIPKAALSPSILPGALQELAGGGNYAVYVFTPDDMQTAKTVIHERVPGSPRMPAHVAAAEAQQQAMRAQAGMAGPAVGAGPMGPHVAPQGGVPMAWGQQPMPQMPFMNPYMGQFPMQMPMWPMPYMAPPAPAPVPQAPAAPSAEVAELKRANEDLRRDIAAQSTRSDEAARVARDEATRREFADALKDTRTEMTRALEAQAQQTRDLIARIAERPQVDPSASLTPVVSVLTAAMQAASTQASAAAEAAKSAGESSFRAVMDMAARQQGQPHGMVEALKASGEMVGLFSKMAMSAMAQAAQASNGQEPAWVAPVREAVGQVGSLAQTLVAGAMGMPMPDPDGAGGEPEGQPQPVIQAGAPAPQALPVPGPGVYGTQQLQPQAAPSLAGGAQAEYIARLRIGAPDLTADQIATAVVHVYRELLMWNAIFPPLTRLEEDPGGVMAALLGDLPAFQDGVRKARLAEAVLMIPSVLNPPAAGQGPDDPEGSGGSNGHSADPRVQVIEDVSAAPTQPGEVDGAAVEFTLKRKRKARAETPVAAA